MMALGVLLIGVMTYRMISDPTTVVQGLDEMLRPLSGGASVATGH